MRKYLNYFSKFEIALLCVSLLLITLSFFIFEGTNYLALAASLTGAFSLIFAAKGNPVAQALMIAFSLMYGYISFTAEYYGEMITYLGMTMPMAVVALVSWLHNPYNGKKSEVKVNRLKPKELLLGVLLTAVVTVTFYFILKAFNTANLLPSTLSVATSFLAVYLTARRSAFYALAYAANDIVLIVLWALALAENRSYLSVLICFAVFLVNDIYGFISWCRMVKRQTA